MSKAASISNLLMHMAGTDSGVPAQDDLLETGSEDCSPSSNVVASHSIHCESRTVTPSGFDPAACNARSVADLYTLDAGDMLYW